MKTGIHVDVTRSRLHTSTVVWAHGDHTEFIACPRDGVNAHGCWSLGVWDVHARALRPLGVYQNGPVGEYPDRGRAEDAMWANVSNTIAAAAGFCGDDGG